MSELINAFEEGVYAVMYYGYLCTDVISPHDEARLWRTFRESATMYFGCLKCMGEDKEIKGLGKIFLSSQRLNEEVSRIFAETKSRCFDVDIDEEELCNQIFVRL